MDENTAQEISPDEIQRGPFTQDAPPGSQDSQRASLEEWSANVDKLLKEIESEGKEKP